MNPEDDMHCRNVAKVLGITPAEVTKEQRAMAKNICFGCRGEEDALEQLQLFCALGAVNVERLQEGDKR